MIVTRFEIDPSFTARDTPVGFPGLEGEARSLCREMIEEDEDIAFPVLRSEGLKRGLDVTYDTFASVHRELAAAGPRPFGAKQQSKPVAADETGAAAPTADVSEVSEELPEAEPPPPSSLDLVDLSPKMEFLVAHRTAHPDATYEETRIAGEAAGDVFPRSYGRAWRWAGLPKLPKPWQRASDKGTKAARPALRSGSVQFVVNHFRAHPEASFREVNEAALKVGHKVYPIIFGLARKKLGLESHRFPGMNEAEPFPSTWPSVPRREPGSRASGSASMDFLVRFLRSHPDATYAEVKAAARDAGHRVFPITFGNARRRAGLAKRRERAVSAKRAGPAGPGKQPRDPASARPDAETRTARPAVRETRPIATPRATRSTPASSPVSSPADPILTELVALVERLERQRADLRETMAWIGQIARESLDCRR